ncbi:MAG: rod shape-determining protein RodA [Actinomycetota bacterium]|nr:rod shape-determining protein RodA [Actinomycetota bacterium]
MRNRVYLNWFNYINRGLIFTVLAIMLFGNLMVYSATHVYDNPYQFLQKQLVFSFLGLAVAVGFMFFDYNRLRQFIVPFYVLNIFLLIVVFFIGKDVYGSTRWIPLGFFNLQPSELAKLVLIITFGEFLADRKGDIKEVKDWLIVAAHVGVPMFLIMLQPDLGTSLVLLAIMLGMLSVSGLRWQQALAIFSIGLSVVFAVLKFGLLHEYQMKRILVFLDPSIDPTGVGYNLKQSKIAIGSGGFLGKGLFSGTQSSLGFLPVRYADFIFSVVAEELGFLGAGAVLLLFLALLIKCISIAKSSGNLFGSLMAIGIGSMWLFQIFVNIGMTMGMMPVTGVPLPFMSYGGSAMMMNMMSVGLLANIYAHRLK